jgi:hypothetical protein
MRILDWSAELRRRNEPLFWFGWFNVLLLLIAVILFFADGTFITGVNAWTKPSKFAISITVYSWTFAWLLFYLPERKNMIFITWGVICCMLVENSLIFMQAARGVRSHFNITTTFDAMIFSTMGIFILLNTFIILYTIILFFSNKIQLEAPLLWAWRSGLVLFFLGGISGGVMSAMLRHTIGMDDGGQGLPLLNWSTVAGDIRSAHFFTLHGLQIIPLAAIAFMKVSQVHSKTMVWTFSILYLGFCIWLHWLAFQGLPLLALR